MTRSGHRGEAERVRLNRRTALAGGVGALTGTVLAQATPAQAANGDAVLLGRDNTERAATAIRNLQSGSTGLRVSARGASSVALEARSPNVALLAEGDRGVGAHGISESGDGVLGQSVQAAGVHGISYHGFGVVGDGDLLAGVVGNSRFDRGVVGANIAPDKPAVQGWAQNGSTGVQGLSAAPDAVVPTAAHTGVHGVCDAAEGTGVLAQSARGVALRVQGRAVFQRSGVLVVPAGASAATRTGIPLTAASLVLATLRRHEPGIHVEAAVPDADHDSFTVHLNRRPRVETAVSWLVVN